MVVNQSVKGGENMIYFTSDLHLGHKGIISMQKRPFENVAEMNRTISNNYNSYVNKDDNFKYINTGKNLRIQ